MSEAPSPYIGTQESLNTCCGVNEIGSFKDYGGWVAEERRAVIEKSGTGLFVAAFVNTPECKVAYEHCCKKHKLLYQSPLKMNSNSGRRLFLCVFEWKSPRKEKQKKSVESLPYLFGGTHLE